MTTRFLATSAVLGLALMLAACNQNQATNTEPSDSTTPAAETESGAPADMAASEAAEAAETGEASAALTEPAPGEPMRRYGTKSGRIEFAVTGTETGTQIVTWDDWGTKEVVEAVGTIKVGTMTMPQNRRIITLPDKIISIDNQTKTATEIQNPMQEMVAGSTAQDAREFGEQMMAAMGAEKQGTSTVLGRTCEVWVITKASTNTCVWEGITLRTDSQMMGMSMTKVATKFDENVAVDSALFEVPEGITVTQAAAQAAPGAAPQLPPDVTQMMQGAMPEGAMDALDAAGVQKPEMPAGMMAPEKATAEPTGEAPSEDPASSPPTGN